MRKYLWLLIFILCVANVCAEKTVKTIDIPVGATASASANQTYIVSKSIDLPDKISRVLFAQLRIVGDYPALTRIYGRVNVSGVVYNCSPSFVTTANAVLRNYVTELDCSNALSNYTGGSLMFGFIVDKTSTNIYGSLSLTYLNNPVADITLHGTEYVSGEYAKVWLQLLDNNKSAIDGAICFIDIYYPSGELFMSKGTMNHLQDGLYQVDFTAPNIVGVYPAVALCYYTGGSINSFPSNITVINGSITAGDVSRVYVLDGSYLNIDETPLALGNPRRLDIGFNWTNMSACQNVPESLMSGISIEWQGRWNSNPTGDTLSIYVFNWSNSSWLLLPNSITGIGTGVKSVSNSFSFNNLTKSGLINNTNKQMKVKFKDTDVADTSTSGFDTDFLTVSCNQLSSPSWELVRGSSEVHITSPDNYNFYPETLCNGYAPNSPNCAVFINDGAHPPEDSIVENISLYNPLGVEIDQAYHYTTSFGVDCTAIDSIEFVKGNVTLNLYNDTIFAIGGSENCMITIPVSFALGETYGEINIHMDNYMKWEVERANDLRQNACILEDACNNIASQYNFSYIIPLNITLQNVTNNSFLIYCSRVLDDLYWFDYYYNSSLGINTVGEYESYYFEVARYYLPILAEHYKYVMNAQSGINELSLLGYANNTFNLLNLTPSLVWNHANRNLTYYPPQQDLTNYSLIQSNQFNYTLRFDDIDLNLTAIQSAMTLNTNNILSAISNIASNVWSFVNRYVYGVLI